MRRHEQPRENSAELPRPRVPGAWLFAIGVMLLALAALWFWPLMATRGPATG